MRWVRERCSFTHFSLIDPPTDCINCSVPFQDTILHRARFERCAYALVDCHTARARICDQMIRSTVRPWHPSGSGLLERKIVIRQAISCDVCGNEKRQTNHWFVAYEQAGELRVAGWNSRNKLRAGTKHLCGQTCLHKLLDDFMARAINQKTQTESDTSAATASSRHAANHPSSGSTGTDASLTSRAAYDSEESSALLISPAVPALPTV